MKSKYKLGLSYFPDKEEVNIIIVNTENEAEITLTSKISPEEGEELAEAIPCCVYHPITILFEEGVREKYVNDPKYHQLVSVLENLLEKEMFTPSELFGAVNLACIKYESRSHYTEQ